VARKDFYLVGTISLAAAAAAGNDSLVSSAWPQTHPHCAFFSPVRSRGRVPLHQQQGHLRRARGCGRSARR
jgi:hypothetical protein